jgi:hypothetical protein
MAYPTYPYPGYQPYYSQPVPDQLAQLRQNQQIPVQPQMMPVQTNAGPLAPNPPQNNGIIWVNGKAEADGYLVAPNSAVPLWDANSPVIYLRQADSTGKPSTKVYDLVERTDGPTQQTASQIDLSRYVTIDQLEDILAERLKRPAKPAKVREDTDNG